jgi:hypothetical protein
MAGCWVRGSTSRASRSLSRGVRTPCTFTGRELTMAHRRSSRLVRTDVPQRPSQRFSPPPLSGAAISLVCFVAGDKGDGAGAEGRGRGITGSHSKSLSPCYGLRVHSGSTRALSRFLALLACAAIGKSPSTSSSTSRDYE